MLWYPQFPLTSLENSLATDHIHLVQIFLVYVLYKARGTPRCPKIWAKLSPAKFLRILYKLWYPQIPPTSLTLAPTVLKT